jgi:hypothetical protein
MEKLKPLDQICKPDPRYELFVRVDQEAGTLAPFTVEDLHANMNDICLRDNVPEPVRSQFNTAKNLFVYSWFVYGFIPASELYAFGALEQALRERGRRENLGAEVDRKRDTRGLKYWLKYAIDHKWLKDESIERYQRNLKMGEESRKSDEAMGLPVSQSDLAPGPQAYCKILADTFPNLRNSLAHGHGMVYIPRALTLEICADLINQLFPEAGGSTE